MDQLKKLRRMLLGLACFLPRTAVDVIRQRRQREALAKLEVERIDRIRNPSKYLGK